MHGPCCGISKNKISIHTFFFEMWNSEFGIRYLRIQNSEFGIRNSEFGIRIEVKKMNHLGHRTKHFFYYFILNNNVSAVYLRETIIDTKRNGVPKLNRRKGRFYWNEIIGFCIFLSQQSQRDNAWCKMQIKQLNSILSKWSFNEEEWFARLFSMSSSR